MLWEFSYGTLLVYVQYVQTVQSWPSKAAAGETAMMFWWQSPDYGLQIFNHCPITLLLELNKVFSIF